MPSSDEAMTSPYTPFHSLPPPTKDTPTNSTKIKKWSSSKKKRLSTNNGGMLVQMFRSRRDNLAQRIKNSNNKSMAPPQPQPLLFSPSKSSPDDDMGRRLKFDMNNIDPMSSDQNFTSPSRSLMSGDTEALTLSSEDSSSPVISNNNKKIHTDAPPANIYATGTGAQLVIGGEVSTEDSWVEFPTQSFVSSNSSQSPPSEDDFGNILASAFGGDDTNYDSDSAADARKRLFDSTNIDFNGFIRDSSASTSMMETLQHEVNELKEELAQTKKHLEAATATNEALNEAHDQKHKELEQLNQDMDKFSDVIMLCMQQLRKRNADLASKNEELKSSTEDMRARMNFLTKCTEALNDAHDRKSEECAELKREMDAFAETFAAQHDNMQELEGRLRNVMEENEELRKWSNDDLGLRVKERGESSRRRRRSRMERIDETPDDDDNNMD
jgi:predicted  nucleic acid-binding Zn-ribbon protein